MYVYRNILFKIEKPVTVHYMFYICHNVITRSLCDHELLLKTGGVCNCLKDILTLFMNLLVSNILISLLSCVLYIMPVLYNFLVFFLSPTNRVIGFIAIQWHIR